MDSELPNRVVAAVLGCDAGRLAALSFQHIFVLVFANSACPPSNRGATHSDLVIQIGRTGGKTRFAASTTGRVLHTL